MKSSGERSRGSRPAAKSAGAGARRSSTPSRTTDPLGTLGLRGSRGELLRYLVLHPDERIHLRKLERLFGARSASLQRDLRELTELGALGRVPSSGGSRRVEYEIVPEWPLWSPFRQIIGALSDPVLLAREALRGITGVEAAFIYGSVAKRQACEDSDVDIFVVGESVDRPRLHRALAEVAILTGREVNPGIYTRQVLQERLVAPASPGHRFLRDVLAGPKIWIAGSREALLPMARAAGLVAFP